MELEGLTDELGQACTYEIGMLHTGGRAVLGADGVEGVGQRPTTALCRPFADRLFDESGQSQSLGRLIGGPCQQAEFRGHRMTCRQHVDG